MSFFQVDDRCNGCMACVQNCPANALRAEDVGEGRTLYHSMTRCARCGNCWRICPQGAVEFKRLLNGNWDEVATMDLVRCMVCGEPIYTTGFGETLSNRLEKNVDHLCQQHKKTFPLSLWKRIAPLESKVKESQSDRRKS